MDPNIHVREKACPLFVPLVEEGFKEHVITEEVIEYYLEYREQIRGANILLSCATIIDRLVRYDPNRYVVSRGVKLVFLMLHRLEKWTIAAGGNMPQLLKNIIMKKYIYLAFVLFFSFYQNIFAEQGEISFLNL
jgi:hypothetical protein